MLTRAMLKRKGDVTHATSALSRGVSLLLGEEEERSYSRRNRYVLVRHRPFVAWVRSICCMVALPFVAWVRSICRMVVLPFVA